LYVATSNEYVQAFKQSSLYQTYLNGGLLGKSSNKKELHLHRASEFGDPMLLVITIAKYTPSCSYASRMSHLEGEEVFGFCKQRAILPLGSKGDSNKHDHVNFFHP
jgi:hypothetical protein